MPGAGSAVPPGPGSAHQAAQRPAQGALQQAVQEGVRREGRVGDPGDGHLRLGGLRGGRQARTAVGQPAGCELAQGQRGPQGGLAPGQTGPQGGQDGEAAVQGVIKFIVL